MDAVRSTTTPVEVARPPWHAWDPATVLDRLDATREGLSSVEAERRFDTFGANEIPVVRATPWWRTLLHQFASPMIIILSVSSTITLVLRDWIDTGAIWFALALNAVIGFWQERKAERDVHALASLSTPSCRVRRDGTVRTIPAPQVVPGDVVLLESGERVPADLRLLESHGLRLDESMLTGEVLAVTKHVATVAEAAGTADRTSMAYSGTLVSSGRGRGVVVATGEATELGAINALVQGPAPPTPLQVLTHRLERTVGAVVLSTALFVFGAGVLLGYDLATIFLTAVALMVSSMPESLPIVLTVAMSIGVSRMARNRAVVRVLPAVETLGSTTVIGSDKTGTLTQNRLTVEVLWTPDGTIDLREGTAEWPLPMAVVELLRSGALTNEARRTGEESFIGDAVDVAMAQIALRAGAVGSAECSARPEAHLPYEPEHGYSQTLRRDEQGRRVLHVKGAPDILLGMATSLQRDGRPGPLDHQLVRAANEELADQGLRVLATGCRVLADDEEVSTPLLRPTGLTLLGLEGMADPPRPGVKEAIEQCRRAGIEVKMITGDHPVTARSIAERLGLPGTGAPLTGAELVHLDDAALAARLHETSVAARVSPQDKLRIVQALQQEGHVVAVTGDGVNDAPALKAASIGVAMGQSGTEVAREAADLVLTDDNFVTIVKAVEQGRVTFAAIRKATFFLLSTGVAALVAVVVNLFEAHPLIFLPVQMLWVNIVTSGVQDIALAFEPGEGDELEQRPRARSEGLLSRRMWFRTLLTGLWMAVGLLICYRAMLELDRPLDEARTMTLTLLVAFSFFQVFNARGERRSVLRMKPTGNPFLLVGALVALALHVAVTVLPPAANVLGLVPLTPAQWAICYLAGSTVLLLVELDKAIVRHARRRAAAP